MEAIRTSASPMGVPLPLQLRPDLPVAPGGAGVEGQDGQVGLDDGLDPL